MTPTQQDFPFYPLDCPLRLAVAAKVAFPDGSMTASGLRREADRGRLVIERIAGKDYTTLNAIAEMRKLCRVEVKDPAFGSNRHGEPTGGSLSKPSGSSETGTSSAALEQARAKLKKLKSRCENTSTKKPPRESAIVTPLPSRSRTS
jgi:hypothetical protein